MVQSWVVSHCVHHHHAHAAKTNIQTRSATGDRNSSPFWDSMRSARSTPGYGDCLEPKLWGHDLQFRTLLSYFFSLNTIFTWKKNWFRQTVISQAWEFGRHFLSNEWNEPVTSRKIANSIGCQWQNSGFQVKIQTLGKPVSATMSLTDSQYLKTFLMKSVVILMVIIIIFVL